MKNKLLKDYSWKEESMNLGNNKLINFSDRNLENDEKWLKIGFRRYLESACRYSNM